MKKLLILILFNLLLLPSMAVSFPAKEKWISLFNGKDLTGWKLVNGKAKYDVVDGMIVGTCVKDSPNSFLALDKEYGDFILELQIKIDDGINSGIQFRSLQKPEDGRVNGYQMEVDHRKERSWSGGIYDEARRGWLYPLELNPSAKQAYKWGDWNTYRIECIGSTIRTWVNDFPAAYLIDDASLKGLIALQVHAVYDAQGEGKKTYWKNIRIQTKNLQARPLTNITVVNLVPNTLSPLEKQQGYRLLWDGKTTTGWRGAFKDSFPDKGWEIKDGILSVLPSNGGESTNGGDIVTMDSFTAFELTFDFKFTEGANSGVKYFVDEKYLSKGSAIGLEYQILDDERHPDAKEGVVGNRTLGSLYDLIPSLKIQDIPRIWNEGRIVVYPDNRIEHWLNGRKIVEYQRGTPIYYALVARSKYNVWEGFGMAEKGYILLQDHGDAVSFRSIKIRVLD
ncbi:MAG: DUF1080 domain-containing protein [Cyclobacteriaceae bacterium]|nr:DUF1080 domain-containing protein [Cyclobacteriaceae bacterium]